MSLYKQKWNCRTGAFNLVPSNQVIAFKESVANAAALPATGNTQNDARITNDTGHLYVWSGTAWIDQGDILDLNWSALSGKPSSAVADIDNAVSLRHVQNSDTKLAEGTDNEVTAANAKDAVDKKHTQNTDQKIDDGGLNETSAAEIRDSADKKHSNSLDHTQGTDSYAASNISNDSSVVGTTVEDALETLLLEKTGVISVNTTYTVKASGGDFTTIQAALDSLKSKWINSDVAVTISVDSGIFTHTSPILFRHPLGNRINIVGAAPVITTITSLISWTGTAGNYSVTLNVASASGMAIGDYCLVNGSTTGTGEYQAIKGCWEITNISGTQITVKNTYRKSTIPTLTITGGSLHCLKTTLKFNGCDGIQVGGATGYLYNLAIVGNGVANCDGINISQRGYYYGNNIVYMGEPSATYSIGINGFGRYGVCNTSTAEVWIINASISNSGSYGVYAYNQSKIAGSGVNSTGNGSIGVYATDGSWITMVSSFAVGNGTVGFYAFNRAGINAELAHAVGNVYSGFQCLGTSYIYAKTSKSINNGYHGYSSSYNGMIYAQSSVATGNGAAINYYGYWSSNGGHIRADSTTASGNFSGDYFAEHFSFIKVTSYVGSPTFSPAVDTMGNGGSIIRSVVATALKIVDTINNVPAGNISATTVQAAINELDTEKANKLISINEQLDSYVLALTDADKLIDMNKATANTLTVPKNSVVAFAIGTTMAIRQKGAGKVTITPVDGDVIINNPDGLKTTNQYAMATIIKVDTNTWTAFGSLEV